MLPADHHELAFRERGRDAEVLLDQEDRETLLLEVLERLDESLDDGRREALRRLVHDEHRRVRHECASDREHLLLTARQLRAAVGLALGEPREELVDAVACPLATTGAGRSASGDAQVLVDGEGGKQTPSLGHVADAAPGDLVRGDADQLVTLEADRALGAGRRDAHDRVAQRRLPHAVAADDGHRLAAHREGDVLERLRAPVERVQSADLEQRRRVGLDSGGRLTHSRSRARGRGRAPSRSRGSRRAFLRRSPARRASSSPARRR